jgi:hypothetical protein
MYLTRKAALPSHCNSPVTLTAAVPDVFGEKTLCSSLSASKVEVPFLRMAHAMLESQIIDFTVYASFL